MFVLDFNCETLLFILREKLSFFNASYIQNRREKNIFFIAKSRESAYNKLWF